MDKYTKEIFLKFKKSFEHAKAKLKTEGFIDPPEYYALMKWVIQEAQAAQKNVDGFLPDKHESTWFELKRVDQTRFKHSGNAYDGHKKFISDYEKNAKAVYKQKQLMTMIDPFTGEEVVIEKPEPKYITSYRVNLKINDNNGN